MLVEISLVYKIEDQFKIEKIDAKQVGNLYQIKSIPAFASNIAYDDIISVETESGELFFDELIEPSGHSVLHIALLKPEFSTNILSYFALLGLGINYLHDNKYWVIDIPPNVDYKALKQFIDVEFERGVIDYEEACLSDNHRSLLR